jgi:hypothetical protein
MYFGNMMMGMVMTIASPLTTVLLREKSLREGRAQALEAVPGALDKTVRALRGAVGDAIASYVDALEDHLALANDALGEQLVATLGRARTRLAEIAASSEDPETSSENLRLGLASLESQLATIQDTLARLDLGLAFHQALDSETPTPKVVH